uniref:Uncharacterized protein n=1 Tax=Anguilla anguilla TaxID=7936 RepID=A0A0E9WP94_ANGAN
MFFPGCVKGQARYNPRINFVCYCSIYIFVKRACLVKLTKHAIALDNLIEQYLHFLYFVHFCSKPYIAFET